MGDIKLSTEGSDLPFPAPTPSAPRSNKPFLALISLFGVLALLTQSSIPLPKFFSSASCRNHAHFATALAALEAAKCPAQPKSINIGTDWDILHDEAYAELAARRLSQAVQHETISYDDFTTMPANDTALNKHYVFADWMYNEYPKVFKTLKHEVINYHGQLLTWEGSNPALQPIILMAHTDVVPVPEDTIGQWTYPPFEGRIVVNATKDTPGTWIWGRGASDCKNQLMGILGATERLATEGFKPERTIIIASGFDEEIGGAHGAGELGKVLQGRYGDNSVAFLLDEGFDGVSQQYGAQVASFGMAEKGAITAVQIKVETPGGHSSVPPKHTGIGIMSLLISQLEAHPFHPSLQPESPYLKWLTCMSDYAPNFPAGMKRQVKHPRMWPKLAHQLARSDRRLNSFLATTQAADLIRGGVKVNALPEVVEAKVNYRIAFTSSVNATLKHLTDVLIPFAKKLDFTISPFTEPHNGKKSAHHITLSIGDAHPLEPAPITPGDTEAFKLMAGTAKHIFGEETIVAPSGMYANTDTRWFWNLTKNIYRFTPALINPNFNVHTVDEKMPLSGHLNTTRFIYKLIRNSEGWNTD